MATYLDRLSMMTNENDENDDAISNDVKEQLTSLLYSNQDFVIMTMNYRCTHILDVKLARKCIMAMWRDIHGQADIKWCCRIFAESLDDLLAVSNVIMPLIAELTDKYSKL